MSIIDVEGPICSRMDVPEDMKGKVYIAKRNGLSIKVKTIMINEIISSSYQSSDRVSKWAVYSKEEKISTFNLFKSKKEKEETKWVQNEYSMYTSDFYSMFSPSGVLNYDLIDKTSDGAIRKLLDSKKY